LSGSTQRLRAVGVKVDPGGNTKHTPDDSVVPPLKGVNKEMSSSADILHRRTRRFIWSHKHLLPCLQRILCLSVFAAVYLCSVSLSKAESEGEAGEDYLLNRQYAKAYAFFKEKRTSDRSSDEMDRFSRVLKYLEVVLFARENLKSVYAFDKIFVIYDAGSIPREQAALLARQYAEVYQKINERLDITFEGPIYIYLYPESMEPSIGEVQPLLTRYNLTNNEIHVHYGGPNRHGRIEHEMVYVMTSSLTAFRGI